MGRRIGGFILLLVSQAVLGAVVLSETVGRVQGRAYTSRQVQLSGLMDRLLIGAKEAKPVPVDEKNETYVKERGGFLLEVALSKEAELLGLVPQDSSAKEDLITKTKKHLQARPEWTRKEYSEAEVQQMAAVKINSLALVKIKSESLKSPISDMDAHKYFEENRRRFGHLPFASFESQIKNVLAKNQMEERLRTWFDLIRRRYQVVEGASGSDPRASSDANP